MNLIKALDGYKTYILVGLGVLVYGAEAMGLLDKGSADKLDNLFMLLGLGTMRLAVAGLFKQGENK